MTTKYGKTIITQLLCGTGISLILLIAFVFFSGCTENAAITNGTISKPQDQNIVFNDTMGNRIMLSHPAEKVVANADDIAEMLIAIGAADKIVGVTEGTKTHRQYIMENLDPEVKSIGSYSAPDIEIISQIKPDVLVAFAYYRPLNVDNLVALNCSVVFFNCEKLEELNNEAYALGEMTGNREGAQKYIRFNRKYQELVESRLANLTPDEVLAVYGETSVDYYVMTRIHCGGQIIEALHARNAFGNGTDVYSPQLSPDWLLSKDPDVIIKMSADQGPSLSSIHDTITSRTGYNNLEAVRSNRVYIIHHKLVSTSRSVVGLVYLAKALYPDRFADIDPEEVRQEYIREFHVGNYSAEWIYPPFDSGSETFTKNNENVPN